MNAETTLARLRRFLYLLAASIFVVTPIELGLTEHYQSAPQLIPFILCGLGLIAVVAALARPSPRTLLVLRVIMIVILLGAVLGVYQHLNGNYEFALEIHPTATTSDLAAEALRGANPLLAPGILVIAAVLALASSYYRV